MNKQIPILATACLVVGLVVAANILPRVLAQVAPGRELEQKIQSMPSTTNATKNQKTVTVILACNKPVLPGEKIEGKCSLATNETTFPVMGVCAASSIQSGKDLEESCDFKPIR